MKNNKVKRLLALVLSSMMVLSVAACGAKEKEESKDTQKESSKKEESKEEVKEEESEVVEEELDFMEISVATWGLMDGDDYIINTIEEKFNVDIVPMNLTYSDHGTKLDLWASTGELPDWSTVDMRHGSKFPQWIKDEVIRDIPMELIAKYPNMEEYMQAETAKSCMYDGDYYAIMRMSYNKQAETVMDRIIYYRWDLAQAAGVTEEPTTYEEFIDMLAAIVETDPENKDIGGITVPEKGYLNHFFACYNNPHITTGGSGMRWEKNADGTYVPSYFKGENLGDEMLPVFQLARDMYTDGLIDPDIALMNDEQCINKFLSGQYAAAVYTSSFMQVGEGSVYSTWGQMYDTPWEDAIKVLNLLPSKNGDTYYWDWDCAWAESVFSANVDDAKMDRILMIMNWLISDEGILNTWYGKEGEDYTIAEDGTVVPAEGLVISEKYPSWEGLSRAVCWTQPFHGEYKQTNNKVDIYNNEYFPTLVAQAEATNNPEHYPECIQAFKSLEHDFRFSYTDDLLVMMLSEEPVEEIWANLIEQYKKDGLEEVIQKVNEAMK